MYEAMSAYCCANSVAPPSPPIRRAGQGWEGEVYNKVTLGRCQLFASIVLTTYFCWPRSPVGSLWRASGLLLFH